MARPRSSEMLWTYSRLMSRAWCAISSHIAITSKALSLAESEGSASERVQRPADHAEPGLRFQSRACPSVPGE